MRHSDEKWPSWRAAPAITNPSPRIFSPYVRKCWATAVCEAARSARFGGLGKGSPGFAKQAPCGRARLWQTYGSARHAADKGFAAPAVFGFGRLRRSVRNARNTSRQALARLAGDIRAIPCETQGGSSRAFLPDPEPRFFSEPGFWSRSDALRRPERGAGLATRGASAGLAGLAGLWVRVILQDWQDRWNVAQIGDIPETGDPRCQSHMPAPHAPSVPDTCR